MTSPTIRPKPVTQTKVSITPHEIAVVRPYEVKPGDRIWNLADEFGNRNRKLFTDHVLRANTKLNPNRLRIGQKVWLPFKKQIGAGVKNNVSVKPILSDRQASPNLKTVYNFQRGDTVWRKAPDYGYTNPRQFVYDFKKFNPGIDPNCVYAGKTYNMPFKGFAGARIGITSSLRPKPTVPQPGSLQWMAKGLR